MRYRHQVFDCVVNRAKNSEKYSVKFQKPQRAITSGQSIVFYKKDEVLGGGII
ncbi:MAG: aminomethyltransferase beta-barrel domain-containing protein [Patescibacteria group bacterium]|nr:aminomethyltransferase beta-barrel domain-containing protein [Patescibacteria group bacterium]